MVRPSDHIEFLVESNRIEGVDDTDSLMQAVYAWYELLEHQKMSVGLILKAHKTLMLHHALRPNEKGYFRLRPVWIGGHEGVKAEHIPMMVEFLVTRMNKYPASESECFANHIEFERIHPFIDGNGRIGRMILNWQLLTNGHNLYIARATARAEYYKLFHGGGRDVDGREESGDKAEVREGNLL